MPDFLFEDEYEGTICGVDEAGRGPWAGPVVAGAVILDRENKAVRDILGILNDSKQVARAARESLYSVITATCEWAVGIASAEEIDRYNILRASLMAMERAITGLGTKMTTVLVDGIHAPSHLPAYIRCVHCIPEGDAKSYSIAGASIIAKVTRDRMMCELAELHPGYGFERHFGYGTKTHQKALRELGPTAFHRRSFSPVKMLVDQMELAL